LGRGIGLASALSLPMAIVLALRFSGALGSIALGGLTYGATLLAAWRFVPGLFASPALPGQARP